jgi:hypothetical protein
MRAAESLIRLRCLYFGVDEGRGKFKVAMSVVWYGWASSLSMFASISLFRAFRISLSYHFHLHIRNLELLRRGAGRDARTVEIIGASRSLRSPTHPSQ